MYLSSKVKVTWVLARFGKGHGGRHSHLSQADAEDQHYIGGVLQYAILPFEAPQKW